MTHPAPRSMTDSAEHWLAYRYLTGALSDEEAAACEARLATEDELQSALADCVRLVSGLADAAQSRAVVRPASPSRAGLPGLSGRSRWWTGVAVGLLVVGLLLTASSLTPRHVDRRAPDQSVAARLDPSSVVALWSELEVQNALLSDQGDAATSVELSDEAALDIPDWMLLAVLEDSADDDAAPPSLEQQL